jgi:2-keto-3-deoxy-L-rhamnonate aldolase RhmA
VTSLRERLGGSLVVGLEIASASPAAIELVGGLGFDLGIIDARHAAVSPYSGEHERLVRAADAARLPVITRIGAVTPGTINRVLNDGSGGVLAVCEHPDEALLAVQSMRYPPLGFRGAAPVVRAARLGLTPWDEYREQTNTAKPLVVSIETREGLAEVPGLAAVSGVDAIVFDVIGLAAGRAGRPASPGDHPAVVDALERVLAAGCGGGVVLPDADLAVTAEWCRNGARVVVLGTDLHAYVGETRALRTTLDAVPTRVGGVA